MIIAFQTLSQGYKDEPPPGWPKNDRNYENTCAIRLSWAIFAVDASFFKAFAPRTEVEHDAWWKALPIRPSELAHILSRKLRNTVTLMEMPWGSTLDPRQDHRREESADHQAAVKTARKKIENRAGAIFFDKLVGYAGTGHITLWNGNRCLDIPRDVEDSFFSRTPRVYFWPLPWKYQNPVEQKPRPRRAVTRNTRVAPTAAAPRTGQLVRPRQRPSRTATMVLPEALRRRGR
jgi:hypothetical protein